MIHGGWYRTTLCRAVPTIPQVLEQVRTRPYCRYFEQRCSSKSYLYLAS
jgi:hypothetical protein